jgi:cell division protein FtsW
MVSTPVRPAERRPAARPASGVFAGAGRALEAAGRRGSEYYVILGASLALTAIGLMMVLSASSVEAIAADTSEFALFLKQATWAACGVALMLLFSRISAAGYRRLAWPALGFAVVLLVLVLTVGVQINGNRNWIQIGGFSMQPSEAAKLALALWCATVLARKGNLVRRPLHAVVPVIPLGGIPILLVLAGGDLGTASIMMLVVAGALFFAGAPLRIFAVLAALAAVAALALISGSGVRNERIAAWLRLNCDNGLDLCLQSDNGMFALASGGWWGVGIGQSRQKWNWIPEAHNDFIFTIIGEEFGLLGTFVVVGLFVVLAVASIRVALRRTDAFARILIGALTVWLTAQAFVNIAMVLGLLPVIGVPLPFISYGGSALTFTLAAVGVVLSFARKLPERDVAAP